MSGCAFDKNETHFAHILKSHAVRRQASGGARHGESEYRALGGLGADGRSSRRSKIRASHIALTVAGHYVLAENRQAATEILILAAGHIEKFEAMERSDMLIRQETLNDYNEVYELIAEAFSTVEHADGNEQDLVVALRKGNAFIPELSLVAEVDKKLAGHILFTKAKVNNDIVLVLAPLSVKPQYQKQGIGTALIIEGHKIARALGYQYSLVLGSAAYYSRVGYIPAEQIGIDVPEEIPAECFMAIKLQENAKAIGGAVVYAEEFGM